MGLTLDALIHSACCALTTRTCRTTWERRWSDSGLTGFSLDLCSCHAYFSGPCPLFLFSHQQPLKGARPPFQNWQGAAYTAEHGLDGDPPSTATAP